MYKRQNRIGQPYLPSNGTEGMWFTGKFCDNCKNQHPDPNKEPQCNDILLLSLIGEQPEEWIHDAQNNPTCTAYINWNWGDSDDWNEPPVIPEDPNQLCIPWDIISILGEDIMVTKTAIFEN